MGGAGTNITASLTAKSGGWNGGAAGGAGTSDSYGYGGAGGGGASDIRIRTDSLYVFGLKTAQLVSIVFVIVGLIGFIYCHFKGQDVLEER